VGESLQRQGQAFHLSCKKLDVIKNNGATLLIKLEAAKNTKIFNWPK
jgi:hypothetical protein